MKDFIISKKFIKDDICRSMSQRMFLSEQTGANINYNDVQCKKSISFYGIFNDIQALCHKKVEDEVGEELIPTYNYSRIYKWGEILKRHVDRESCEISFTITLDYALSPWSFWARSNDQDFQIILNRGDACIYRGCAIEHWRDQMIHQNWQTQAFFHYVRKNGPYANHAHDQIVNRLHHNE